jgi:hypothetical protein
LTIEKQNLEVTELKMQIEGTSADVEAMQTKTMVKREKTQELMQTGSIKGLGQLTKKGLPDAIPEDEMIGESESEIESARLGVLDNLAKNTKHLNLNHQKLDDILGSGHFYNSESDRDMKELQAMVDQQTPSNLGSLNNIHVGLDMIGAEGEISQRSLAESYAESQVES